MFLAEPGRGAFQGDRKGNYLHVCLLIRPPSASGVPQSHFTPDKTDLIMLSYQSRAPARITPRVNKS